MLEDSPKFDGVRVHVFFVGSKWCRCKQPKVFFNPTRNTHTQNGAHAAAAFFHASRRGEKGWGATAGSQPLIMLSALWSAACVHAWWRRLHALHGTKTDLASSTKNALVPSEKYACDIRSSSLGIKLGGGTLLDGRRRHRVTSAFVVVIFWWLDTLSP